jgi:hypothetical protein
MNIGGMLGGLLAASLLWGQALPDAGRYPSPVDLALSQNGHRLYVVCEGTSELAVADPAMAAASSLPTPGTTRSARSTPPP